MSVIADVVAVLNGRTAIKNLLFTAKNGAKAIRPSVLDQGDLISATAGGIAVRSKSKDPKNTLEFAVSKECTVELLIDCVGKTSLQCNAIADQVSDYLDIYQGTQAGGFIHGFVVDDRVEDWVTNDDGTRTGEYCVELPVTCLYRRN